MWTFGKSRLNTGGLGGAGCAAGVAWASACLGDASHSARSANDATASRRVIMVMGRDYTITPYLIPFAIRKATIGISLCFVPLNDGLWVAGNRAPRLDGPGGASSSALETSVAEGKEIMGRPNAFPVPALMCVLLTAVVSADGARDLPV